jgi:hypothetical protein
MAGAVMAERAGDHELLAWLLQALTDAQEHLGRVGQARATAAQALDAARRAGSRVQEGGIQLRLGRLWAAEGPQAAEGHLLRWLAIASQLDDGGLEVQCRVRLAGLARMRGEVYGARAELGRAARLTHAFGDPYLAAEVWQGWAELAQAQSVPARQAAVLWALTALHGERAGSAEAAGWWEKAEQAAAEAGEPVGRASLAAHAEGALAHDGGWGLLKEVFGSVDADQPSRDRAAAGA